MDNWSSVLQMPSEKAEQMPILGCLYTDAVSLCLNVALGALISSMTRLPCKELMKLPWFFILEKLSVTGNCPVKPQMGSE